MSCYDEETEKYSWCDECCNDECKYCYQYSTKEKPTKFISVDMIHFHLEMINLND
jgi:hypothetical protein